MVSIGWSVPLEESPVAADNSEGTPRGTRTEASAVSRTAGAEGASTPATVTLPVKTVAFDAHLFTCSICLEFNVEPVSLLCGHTFCKSCVAQVADRKVRKPCPLCRRTTMPVMKELSSLAANAGLLECAKKLFPEKFKARNKELERIRRHQKLRNEYLATNQGARRRRQHGQSQPQAQETTVEARHAQMQRNPRSTQRVQEYYRNGGTGMGPTVDCASLLLKLLMTFLGSTICIGIPWTLGHGGMLPWTNAYAIQSGMCSVCLWMTWKADFLPVFPIDKWVMECVTFLGLMPLLKWLGRRFAEHEKIFSGVIAFGLCYCVCATVFIILYDVWIERMYDVMSAKYISTVICSRLFELPWLALKNALRGIDRLVIGFTRIFGGTFATFWQFPWLLEVALVILR